MSLREYKFIQFKNSFMLYQQIISTKTTLSIAKADFSFEELLLWIFLLDLVYLSCDSFSLKIRDRSTSSYGFAFTGWWNQQYSIGYILKNYLFWIRVWICRTRPRAISSIAFALCRSAISKIKKIRSQSIQ